MPTVVNDRRTAMGGRKYRGAGRFTRLPDQRQKRGEQGRDAVERDGYIAFVQ